MNRIISNGLVLCLLSAGIATIPATPRAMSTNAPTTATVFQGLGSHSRPIATSNTEVQKFFDQGMNFMFAFNHDEAIRAFTHAATLEPQCAMAHWGVALSHGINYNFPIFPPEKVKAATAAINLAKQTANLESPQNQALINALATRYVDPIPEDFLPLEKAYSEAMKAAYEKYPADADIGALYAESMMNLRPWQLWTPEGDPAPETPAIMAALESVLKTHANHPLALHLYIHTLEASSDPSKADDAANRLRDLTPALGHLVHMPSHIDVRRGRWQQAIESNRKAIAADSAYQKVSPEQGFYRLYMAHNYHMLAFAALMQGQSKLSLDTIREMIADVPAEWLKVPDNAAIADAFLAMPLEVLKRFGKWDEILAEPEPAETFPIARAMRHYARGVAFAAKGEVENARKSQQAFLTAKKLITEEATFGNNLAVDVIQVADRLLEGEIQLRDGNTTAAIATLEEAVESEKKLRYSEPPDWIVPTRHALGVVLLHSGQPDRAEKVYRDDLIKWPDNGWSLYGLAQSLEDQGKADEAKQVRQQFDKIWANADIEIPSSCFCVPD